MTSDQDSPEKLGEFLKKHGISKASAGKALDVSHVTILEWIERRKHPSPPHKRAIATWTRGEVPEDGWPLSDREKALEEKADKVRPFDQAPESPRGGA